MYALACVVDQEQQEEKWQTYMATSFWGLGRVMWGDDWKLPGYIDFAYPETVQKDTRSAEQIIDDFIEGLVPNDAI